MEGRVFFFLLLLYFELPVQVFLSLCATITYSVERGDWSGGS